jgi:hypothetical protein
VGAIVQKYLDEESIEAPGLALDLVSALLERVAESSDFRKVCKGLQGSALDSFHDKLKRRFYECHLKEAPSPDQPQFLEKRLAAMGPRTFFPTDAAVDAAKLFDAYARRTHSTK